MSLYVGSVPFRAPPPQFPAPPEGRLDGGEGVSEEREGGRERERERERVNTPANALALFLTLTRV